jgi:uncharacterized protein
MTPAEARALIDAIAAWVGGRSDLRGLALVSSWALGAARPDSDLDLLILAARPDDYSVATTWLDRLLVPEGVGVDSFVLRDYGRVWSCHKLRPHTDLELSFCDVGWTATEPIDPGTRSVVENGFRIILDKDAHFRRLVDAS